MQIATVLNAHSDIKCTVDTLDSIKTYVGENILVVIDGKYWNKWKNLPIPAYKLKGFYHGYPKSPYRNMALGLKKITNLHPNSDWYLYTEPDCLFTSSEFKKSLKHANLQDIWMLGNNGRQEKNKQELSLIEAIIKEKIKTYHYMLGCCMFFCNEFMEILNNIDFFDKLINISNHFTQGYFPFYKGYDLSEHLYPTLATHFGGDIGTFASWDETKRTWSGSYRKFPMRWQPQLDKSENFKETSIAHPIKDYMHPIRQLHRKRRNKLWKNTTQWLSG